MNVPKYPQFFDYNEFVIDEKIGLFKFSNAYKVFNREGEEIGLIQQRVSGFHKALRVIGDLKKMMPFTLEILDTNGMVQATISRGWTLFLSKISITDSNGVTIGSIKQKFKLFKPRFIITDQYDQTIAEINGDWKAWDFTITDAHAIPIGSISKKWNGAMREIFTSADKYVVSIEESVAEDTRKIAIVSTAITIDMVLKER
ncbi:phospholipid scramblase-related protein [Siphonobacter sp. SORGH_AS_1065]|uniref:phospholipid scramblase-related protein n=1 Tax=Siphonobacter sp. SORGH_AS_1065 TaxID=3041795 RepID=UPI00277D19ED|nr:phospholipid scramblase-related protein [Siphonobacter sp. SORGH_AS_1065]MDQ1087733.1 uncharacterized protein YxjI [Siphonobacter sp. SORGH_AS_1065]